MNPEVRAIDAHRLLIRAKRDIETLLKHKEETVKVNLNILRQYLSYILIIWLK